jgi:hypothetical protein
LPLVLALVVVIATAGVLAIRALADTGGCSDANAIRLTVAADPAIAPAVRQLADEWTRTAEPEVNGACVAVEVSGVATADIAGRLAVEAGGFVDVATPAPVSGELPAVWIPESSYWMARLQSVSRNLFANQPAALATSPVVLAASPAAAQLLGDGPVNPADLRAPVLAAAAAGQPPPVRLAEPRRDAAALVGATWLHQATVTTDAELPNVVAAFRGLGDAPADASALLTDFDALQRSGATAAPDATDPGATPEPGAPTGLLLAPVSEQAVIAHNQAVGATSIDIVPVIDAPSLDFPYAVLSRAPRDVQTAASALRTALAGGTAVFEQHGFRPATPPVRPVGPPEQVGQVLRIWTSATRDARVLSVVNVNTSMSEPLGPARRVDVFRATAQQGLALFTDDSELGHWEYAEDWSEGVPIAPLTEQHRQQVLGALAAMQVAPTDESALFETLLAAYRELKDGYDRTRSNTLIIWTDGGNNQPGGLTLAETLQELERLADLTRPIRVVLLGLGPDADMAELSAIARATGGGAFHLEDPEQIALIFLQALLT